MNKELKEYKVTVGRMGELWDDDCYLGDCITTVLHEVKVTAANGDGAKEMARIVLAEKEGFSPTDEEWDNPEHYAVAVSECEVEEELPLEVWELYSYRIDGCDDFSWLHKK